MNLRAPVIIKNATTAPARTVMAAGPWISARWHAPIVFGDFKTPTAPCNDQIVIIDLTAPRPTIDAELEYNEFSGACPPGASTPPSDVDFSRRVRLASPATGGAESARNTDGSRSLCDTLSRWSTNRHLAPMCSPPGLTTPATTALVRGSGPSRPSTLAPRAVVNNPNGFRPRRQAPSRGRACAAGRPGLLHSSSWLPAAPAGACLRTAGHVSGPLRPGIDTITLALRLQRERA